MGAVGMVVTDSSHQSRRMSKQLASAVHRPSSQCLLLALPSPFHPMIEVHTGQCTPAALTIIGLLVQVTHTMTGA